MQHNGSTQTGCVSAPHGWPLIQGKTLRPGPARSAGKVSSSG